jgi:hypothetical protein
LLNWQASLCLASAIFFLALAIIFALAGKHIGVTRV